MPSKPSTRPPEPQTELSFEDALRELESVVARLEAGGVPLEESLRFLQRGQELAARCEQVLGEAELTLRTLVLTDEGELELEGEEDGDES